VKDVVVSILLLTLVLNITRKAANAITKRVVFSKPFIQLVTGFAWGLMIALLAAAAIHFTRCGLFLKVLWYLGGCYMAYVSFGHDQRVMDAMAVTNGTAVLTYVLVSTGLYFLLILMTVS